MLKNTLIALLYLIPIYSFAETILIVGDKWCPYNCEPQTKKMGYMIDVARIIFERKGHNIDYQVRPWTTSIEDVRNKKATALVATSLYDAPDFIFPSQSMGSNKDCFYKRTDDEWNFKTLEDLKKRKLGAVAGYAYSAQVVSYMDQNPKLVNLAEGIDPLKANLDKLDNQSIDVIVENPNVFKYYVNKENRQNRYIEAGCVGDHELYIAFSPKNPRSKEFAKILTDGLEELRKDGTLDKITAKYNLKEWR